MHRIKGFRRVVVLASVCTLAACTYGPGPIEKTAIHNMETCQATRDQQACDQWTYAAPLVQGERDRQQAENAQKADGAAVAGIMGALVGFGLLLH
jgi:hypothetical protein